MIVKNCGNCGTTNELTATACMVCANETFLAPHAPVADLDGARVGQITKEQPVVIVVEVPVKAA